MGSVTSDGFRNVNVKGQVLSSTDPNHACLHSSKKQRFKLSKHGFVLKSVGECTSSHVMICYLARLVYFFLSTVTEIVPYLLCEISAPSAKQFDDHFKKTEEVSTRWEWHCPSFNDTSSCGFTLISNDMRHGRTCLMKYDPEFNLGLRMPWKEDLSFYCP